MSKAKPTPALTPAEYVRQQRLARRHCTLCARVDPALVAIADKAHRDDGVGSASMAGWLTKVAGITVDHNRWSRHWAMQDEGTHP